MASRWAAPRRAPPFIDRRALEREVLLARDCDNSFLTFDADGAAAHRSTAGEPGEAN